jgi:hypothetical protein
MSGSSIFAPPLSNGDIRPSHSLTTPNNLEVRFPNGLAATSLEGRAKKDDYPICFVCLNLFFAIFCPKNACQVPKPIKQLNPKEIEWHVSSTQSAIIRIEIKKSPGQAGAFAISDRKTAITHLVGRI